jgi:hypothetical protein
LACSFHVSIKLGEKTILLERLELAESRATFVDWSRLAMLNGASMAHAWTKVPDDWSPSPVATPAGFSTLVGDVVGSQAEALATLWGENLSLPGHHFGNTVYQPREVPPPALLRKVGTSFSRRTVAGVDDFHPRHLECLCDDALQVLGTLLVVSLAAGLSPMQVMLVIEFLLAKPTGGWRPIGLYPTFQRWMQRWQREANALEAFRAATKSRSNATGKGKTVTDSVYRQSVRAEVAAHGGLCALPQYSMMSLSVLTWSGTGSWPSGR